MEKVEGMAEFVLAFGKVFEFALGIVLGAESDVVNTAGTETVDMNEVAFVEGHEAKAVAELGLVVFGIHHILSLQVVDMLKSDLEYPGVLFGPRVGFAFAHEIESTPCENIHVVPSEDLPESQIGANMDELQFLELDLTAVGTVGIQDTPAGQQFGFATSFQVSIGAAWPDSGNSLHDKMCNGSALGMMLQLDSKSKYGLGAGLLTEKTQNVGHQAELRIDPESVASKDWSDFAEPSAVHMLESVALTGREPENEYLMLNESEAVQQTENGFESE